MSWIKLHNCFAANGSVFNAIGFLVLLCGLMESFDQLGTIYLIHVFKASAKQPISAAR
jgi:hypothetical protein